MANYEKLRNDITIVAETLGAANNWRTSTVFQRVTGDPKAAYRLENGYDFKVKTYDGWMQSFSDYWPDWLPWPEGVERPEKSSKITTKQEQ